MEQLQQIIENLIEKMGFEDFSVNFDQEGNRMNIIIDDGNFLERFLPNFIMDFTHLVKLINKKNGWGPVVIDVNNCRKKRQDLILELARAAARKTAATKESIILPPMNSYERRLVHTELAGRPDLTTESIGEGKERCVEIKPI